jgi:diguanylate cyclase (GGDEF)-like protein
MMTRPRVKHRASVGLHLVAAFSLCLMALAVVMALSTTSTFRQERTKTQLQLRSVAQAAADQAAEGSAAVIKTFQSIARQPGVTALDPVECQGVLNVFPNAGRNGRINLFRADGSTVCAVKQPGLLATEVAKGDWFGQVLESRQPVNAGTAIDPVSGRPSLTVAIPVGAPEGRGGVLAALLYTDSTPMTLPSGAPPGTILVQFDADRRLALRTSSKAPFKTGPVEPSSALAHPVGSDFQKRKDPDGVTRYYVEAVAGERGLHILAGLPRGTALASARAELHRNLWLGGAVFLAVTALGVVLHRRLALPIRRLREAIEAASHDDTAQAAVAGPAEIAAVAEAFNATIGQRRQLESQLAHEALHDPLTNLPNRALLKDRLGLALVRQSREGGLLAVSFMDLDRFKIINDSQGHPAGDALLVGLARRLRAAMRSTDTVARFGGDEFVMVSEGLRAESDVGLIANRLIGCLTEPFVLEGQDVYLSGSVGVAVGDGSETTDELLRNADAAMYEAKERERGGFAIYHESVHAGLLSRLETERDLRRAIDEGEFILYYQPKCSVATGDVMAVEALVRWAHPTRGLVSPGEFIPVAEDTGLIVPIGQLVLREACRQTTRWRDEHGLEVPVSVNLSARQLTSSDIVDQITDALGETGADPTALCLEITEGTLLVDTTAVVARLAEIRRSGVRISVDDFGTGYSSLSYLRTLPLDEIKIDRSFITPLGEVPSAASIVGSIVGLGHALGFAVVAEGVETALQLATLRDLGCDLAQGFHLARPQPAEALTPLLARSQAAPSPS